MVSFFLRNKFVIFNGFGWDKSHISCAPNLNVAFSPIKPIDAPVDIEFHARFFGLKKPIYFLIKLFDKKKLYRMCYGVRVTDINMSFVLFCEEKQIPFPPRINIIRRIDLWFSSIVDSSFFDNFFLVFVCISQSCLFFSMRWMKW